MFKKGQSGNPKGRPRGIVAKATREIRELASNLTTANPDWIKATQERLLEGKEPSAVVVTLLHYAHGKPTESINLSGTVESDAASVVLLESRIAGLAAAVAAGKTPK